MHEINAQCRCCISLIMICSIYFSHFWVCYIYMVAVFVSSYGFQYLSKQMLLIMVLYSWWHLLLLSSFPSQYSCLFIWCDITYAHGTALLNETSSGLAEMCFPMASSQMMIWPAICICKLGTSECVTWNRDVQSDMFCLHLSYPGVPQWNRKLRQCVREVILSIQYSCYLIHI
jgi:hypothetical protein